MDASSSSESLSSQADGLAAASAGSEREEDELEEDAAGGEASGTAEVSPAPATDIVTETVTLSVPSARHFLTEIIRSRMERFPATVMDCVNVGASTRLGRD